MDENAVESTAVEMEDDFDDSGWDDEVLPAEETEDAAEETSEAEPEAESDGADQPDGTVTEESKPAETDAQPEQKPEADAFELKYMGETKTVGKEEAVVLAQKGLDYDRIRQERDSMSTELDGLRADKGKLTEYEDFLSALARSVGMDIPAMMDSTRAKMLVAEEKKKGNTISEDFALQKIKFEKEKAAFEKQKGESGKQQPEKTEEKKPEQPRTDDEAAQARRNDEAAAFLKAYPNVDPKSIPKEVINQWMSGVPLTAAYTAWENKELKAKLAAYEQNEKNSKRSTGSAKSAGAGRVTDPVFAGWDD